MAGIEINKERARIAMQILCPLENCKALPGRACEILAWAESESLHHGVIHLIRYRYAVRSLEDRDSHDPGDEDRSCDGL